MIASYLVILSIKLKKDQENSKRNTVLLPLKIINVNFPTFYDW